MGAKECVGLEQPLAGKGDAASSLPFLTLFVLVRQWPRVEILQPRTNFLRRRPSQFNRDIAQPRRNRCFPDPRIWQVREYAQLAHLNPSLQHRPLTAIHNQASCLAGGGRSLTCPMRASRAACIAGPAARKLRCTVSMPL